MSRPSNDISHVLTTENVESFIKDMMTSLVHSTKSSNSIPVGSDYEYYSNFGEFRLGMGDLSSNLAGQIQQICQVVQRSSDDTTAPPIDLADAALYDLVVDMIDVLLESADSKISQMSGGGDKLATSIRDSLKTDQDRVFAENSKDMTKPQLKFLEEIDNSRRRPFRPRLRTKPHSITPLDISEQPIDVDATTEQDYSAVGPNTFYPHPYTREILGVCNRSQYESQITDAGFVSPELPSAGQPFELIETLEALQRMAEELDGVKEVAVDLEHHHWRSFQGLTCLMQLSCRDKDYIVDVLALRQHMEVLLPLFTDPDVVKVFHGCDKDIMWLQRDLGLYVVNCFDTYHAAKLLRYPALSLAHLLKFYCGVALNKKYQLADWRERPLPPHLIEYAKLDTHYLLYVYDCLRRDVHSGHGSSGIKAVYEASRRTCLQRYEKASFYPLGYLKLLSPRGASDQEVANDLTFEQNAVLSCLWNWRDLTARRTDESGSFIMSNAELLRIGKAVPADAQAIVATGPLSAYVREHLDELSSVIQEHLHGQGGDMASADKSMEVSTDVGGDESLTLNLPSPSRPTGSNTLRNSSGKKRSSFEIGMGGTRHQMGRMQGYSTVTDFTPCLPAVPAVSSFHASSAGTRGEVENLHRNYQDVMETDQDWKKKLFEEANWRPQNSTASKVTVEASLDPVLSGAQTTSLGNSMASRIEKSEGELQQFSIFHESRQSLFGSSDGSNEKRAQPSIVKKTADSPAEIELLDTLPKSLSDIYNISNRNRWKNKDKKRNRDAADVVVPTNVLDIAESSASTDWYHVEKDPETRAADVKYSADLIMDNVDSTLDFAGSIGWMGSDSSSREDIRKKHLSNESNNNSHSNESGKSSNSQHDQSSMSGGDGVSSSYDGKKSGAKGAKQGTNKDKSANKDSTHSFYDYTRASSVNSGMGAMSTVNTGVTDRDGGKYNPFLQSSVGQGGNGGYSNAANRSNNNNASKPRKQPSAGGKSKHNPTIIERRDTNRSHIFSASSNK